MIQYSLHSKAQAFFNTRGKPPSHYVLHPKISKASLSQEADNKVNTVIMKSQKPSSTKVVCQTELNRSFFSKEFQDGSLYLRITIC